VVPTLARVVAWALATFIVVLSITPPDLRPNTGSPHAVEHFLVYWVTGLAFALAYSLTPLLVIVLVIFSGAVELIQLLVPGRHARLSDFIIDALASVCGLIAVLIVNQMRARTRR
jgi:VanZ family protein